jgi:hypothetical protein
MVLLSAVFVICKIMTIKKKYIGSKVYHSILNQFILIEAGKEERYEKLGLDIFVKPRKPKLQKNDKTSKRRNDNVRDDGDGTIDDNKS